MQEIKVFENSIFLSHCPHIEYYKNEDVIGAVKRIFELPEVTGRIRGEYWDSQYGDGETTEINPYLGPANIEGIQPLMRWIKEECINTFGISNVTVDRSWTNKMWKGTQGKCHSHLGIDNVGKTPDAVAIFYMNNPDNGSPLIIMRNGEHGKLYKDFPPENNHFLSSKTGDLIIHKPDLWHAVGIHGSEEPRICFVFHLLFT